MKITSPLLGVLMAGTVAASVAWAEPGDFAAERFNELDADGDGQITQSEAEAQSANAFDDADVDGNGTLSEDEARAFHDARHQARRERHEARRSERRESREGSPRFDHADENDNGVIDENEFSTMAMNRFEGADLDENGVVTQTEMEIVGRMRHEGRGERGRHQRGHGPDGDDG